MASGSVSTVVLKSDELGPTLTDVVEQAWLRPFTVSSNYARKHAPVIAVAASCGFITTRLKDAEFTTAWRPTRAGLSWLHMQENK